MVATGDQNIRLARIIDGCVLAYLEGEDFPALETRTDLNVLCQLGVRRGQGLELRHRLVVAMKLAVREFDLKFAASLRFVAASRTEASATKQPRRNILELFKSIEARHLEAPLDVLLRLVGVDRGERTVRNKEIQVGYA